MFTTQFPQLLENYQLTLMDCMERLMCNFHYLGYYCSPNLFIHQNNTQELTWNFLVTLGLVVMESGNFIRFALTFSKVMKTLTMKNTKSNDYKKATKCHFSSYTCFNYTFCTKEKTSFTYTNPNTGKKNCPFFFPLISD